MWDLTDASSSNDASPPIPCLQVPAHQSGINSLAVWAEKQGQQQDDGCLVTVASGGDDGQLTVSTVKVHYPDDGKGLLHQLQLRLHSSTHIPLAHAAPLTALRLLTSGLLVSTSADQRVCVWRVCRTNISHRRTLCCHVADAAGLAVWEGEMEGRGRETGETERGTGDETKSPTEMGTSCKQLSGWVLVCGQGLQLLRVRELK